MSVAQTSLIEEMKQYIGFSADDAATLSGLAVLIEPRLEQLADRFYEQIPRHPGAAQVFRGGEAQVARLKVTLQQWARYQNFPTDCRQREGQYVLWDIAAVTKWLWARPVSTKGARPKWPDAIKRQPNPKV